MVAQSESVVALGIGATANLARYEWLDSRNLFLEKLGLLEAVPYPSPARFKFGNGWFGEVKHAADIKGGIAGRKGAFTASVLDAESPALLRKGALEALGAQLDFERDELSLLGRGVKVPFNVAASGHYTLSVVELGKGPPCLDRRPNLAASYFEWSLLGKRPDLSDGGLHLPFLEGGPLRSVPPKDFSACTAVTLGDARDINISDPRRIIMELHVNWWRASATQLKRVLVDSDGGHSHLAHHVDEVLETREARRAFDAERRRMSRLRAHPLSRCAKRG